LAKTLSLPLVRWLLKMFRPTRFGVVILLNLSGLLRLNLFMSKNILMLLCCALAQLTPLAYQALFGYGEYYIYPSLISHSLLIVPIIVIFLLKNRYSKAFLIVWIAWLYVGELKILTYFAINPYYISMDEGCIIYNIYLIFLSIGMLLHDANTRVPKLSVEDQATGRLFYNDLGVFEYILLAFPLIWIIDFVRNVGFIPILSGNDVTDTMYGLNYGYIYNFGFFNCLSAVLLYDRLLKSTTKQSKTFWLIMLIMAVVIMSADSKRLYLLVSLLAIFVYDKLMAGKLTINSNTAIMVFSGLFLYVILQNIRLGSTTESPFARDGFPLGAEFREYVRAINEFKPGEIPGYDLAASTVGAFVNSFLLKVAGYDKSELVHKDSAYSFMKLFDSDNTLGIRTGLTSEIYFAYGFYGLIFITFFGWVISYLSYRLIRVNEKSSLVFLSTIYGLLVLTAFGQSSVTVGCLSVLLYLYLLIVLVKSWSRRQENPHQHLA
jgi:low affinity Fe/Cu permease